MNLIEKVHSKVDSTIKYIFESNDDILEFSYINKNDGKDIIVVPSQTGCNLGCKFCFLTGSNIPVRNITQAELSYGVFYIIENLKLFSTCSDRTLLISFMGCGEPLYSINKVIETMISARDQYSSRYKTVRFALASLIPTRYLFLRFQDEIIKNKLKCKFHYSLHTTNEILRKELMPGASIQSLDLVNNYINETGNHAEIHYSLMRGVNDSKEEALKLIQLLENTKIGIKILKLSEKPEKQLISSIFKDKFITLLKSSLPRVEYYEPPGNDVGASCGQFLLNYYTKDKK